MPYLLPRVRPALAALFVSVAVLTALALLVHDASNTRFDQAIFVRIRGHVPARAITAALRLTDPALVVALLLLFVLCAAVRRRWDVVVLTVIVPVTSVVLTEYVLKPWVHRTNTGHLAFPSGHEAGVASFACVAGLVLLSARTSTAARVIGVVVLAAEVAAAAVGLVGGQYHYATDTVGSLALCLTVTIVVALALDAGKPRRRIERQPADEAPPHVHPAVSNESSGRATV